MIAAVFTATDGVLLAVVVALIAASAVFSLAETSLVRMTRARAKALEDEGHLGARSLRRLAEDPDRFLTPVLLLVLLCQLVAATLVGVVASHLFGGWGVAAATAFEVIVIFVFGESVPKSWAVRNSGRAALLAAPLVTAIIRVAPVRMISSALVTFSEMITPKGPSGRIGSRHGGPRKHTEVTESELLAMADVAAVDEVIETEERALIHSIIDFGDTVVREVMVPRPDIIAVAGAREVGDVLELAIAAGYSRIPVYGEDLDDIVGIAYTKDLMRAAIREEEHRPVDQLRREAHYVPETKRVAPLMRQMQAEQFHIAVVIDEYGGTAGLVTLEDLIEELVGEIVDEFDVDEPLIEPLPDDQFRVSGRMPVDELNEVLRADLPIGDWDTVGGLVMALLGHIPIEGESVAADGHILTAERVQGRRIGRVRIATAAHPGEREGADGASDTGARGGGAGARVGNTGARGGSRPAGSSGTTAGDARSPKLPGSPEPLDTRRSQAAGQS